MLIDDLQKLTEMKILPYWNDLQEKLRIHAKDGNATFTFYSKNYMKDSNLIEDSVYEEPTFTALVEKCKSEGLSPITSNFNNSITGVIRATVSW